MTKGRFSFDELALIPSRVAAKRAFSVLNTVSSFRPEELVVALAASFLLICERFGVDPRHALGISERIINHAEGKLPEFAAIRDYLNNEV